MTGRHRVRIDVGTTSPNSNSSGSVRDSGIGSSSNATMGTTDYASPLNDNMKLSDELRTTRKTLESYEKDMRNREREYNKLRLDNAQLNSNLKAAQDHTAQVEDENKTLRHRASKLQKENRSLHDENNDLRGWLEEERAQNYQQGSSPGNPWPGALAERPRHRPSSRPRNSDADMERLRRRTDRNAGPPTSNASATVGSSSGGSSVSRRGSVSRPRSTHAPVPVPVSGHAPYQSHYHHPSDGSDYNNYTYAPPPPVAGYPPPAAPQPPVHYRSNTQRPRESGDYQKHPLPEI